MAQAAMSRHVARSQESRTRRTAFEITPADNEVVEERHEDSSAEPEPEQPYTLRADKL